MKLQTLEMISAEETVRICGGADKNAQNALYYIGYALGFIVRCIVKLFSGKEPTVEVDPAL